MEIQKRIALVACDAQKRDFMIWIQQNAGKLSRHRLYVCGIDNEILLGDNGLLAEQVFQDGLWGKRYLTKLMIDGGLDVIICFWDPVSVSPYDVDIDELICMAAMYNVVSATNRASADFLISSTHFEQTYEPITRNYSNYVKQLFHYSEKMSGSASEMNDFILIT